MVAGWCRVCFGLLLLCLWPTGDGRAENWPVRVLLREGEGPITLRAQASCDLVSLAGGHIRARLLGGSWLQAEAGAGGILINASRGPSPGFRLSCGAPILVAGVPYRGSIEVRRNGSGGIAVVNELPLETYLRGVMKAEVAPDWPLEALKAQAVVARTYALYQVLSQREALYHLAATTASQVYGGVHGEGLQSSEAVEATAGIVLTYQGGIVPAFYHAASGGSTEDAVAVWDRPFPYIVGVDDPFSVIAPNHRWEVTLTTAEVRRALVRGGYDVGPIRQVVPLSRTRSGRIARLRIWHDAGTLKLQGKDFRSLLGPDRIRSTNFDVVRRGETLRFVGQGWGHGVGMSQWGAKAMADLAYDYLGILKHYFPLAELMRLPE